MAIFDEDDTHWGDLDAYTILTGGLVSLYTTDDAELRQWLAKRGYVVETLDFSRGFDVAAAEIDRVFHWREKFGYDYAEGSRGLDSLNDGFSELPVRDGTGLVLVVVRPDLLWLDQRRWVERFLDSARDHTVYWMMLGRRFFTVVEVEPGAAILGAPLGPPPIVPPVHASTLRAGRRDPAFPAPVEADKPRT